MAIRSPLWGFFGIFLGFVFLLLLGSAGDADHRFAARLVGVLLIGFTLFMWWFIPFTERYHQRKFDEERLEWRKSHSSDDHNSIHNGN